MTEIKNRPRDTREGEKENGERNYYIFGGKKDQNLKKKKKREKDGKKEKE